MRLPPRLLERTRGGVLVSVAFGGALACAEPAATPIVAEPTLAPAVVPAPAVAAVDPVGYDDAAEALRLAREDSALASNEERRERRIAAASAVRPVRVVSGDWLGPTRGPVRPNCGRG